VTSGSCAACGGAVAADAKRCPACGLAFLPPAKDDPLSSRGVPRHVEFYVGDAPRVVAAANAGVEGVDYETPFPPAPTRPPVDPRVRRRRWIVAATIVLAVAAVVVALVRAHRPDDDYTRQELAYERFLHADRLAPVDVPDVFDADASIAELGRAHPDALRAATAAHRPLPDAAGLSVHAYFDAFFERALEVWPDLAHGTGRHPHPRDAGRHDDATGLRWLLLCRDASRALRAWPDAAALSAHDEADRAALLGFVDLPLRWRPTPDIELLDHLGDWLVPLVGLAEISCCSADDRIAAATDRLRALPDRFAGALARLNRPPRALVESVAARLDDADAYLETYADAWPGASDEGVRRLREAVGPAREAVRSCVNRLRGAVLAHASSGLSIGAENVALLLRVRHALPLDARTIYADALAELRAAHDDLRRIASGPRPTGAQPDFGRDAVQVDALRRASSEWAHATPPDAGVDVAPMPRLWRRDGREASYLDAGTTDAASRGVVHVQEDESPAAGEAGDYDALHRRHVLAHESYPGHRLEAVFRRAVCPLRRFLDDRVFVEGWAVYAEDLLHDAGRCAGGAMDEWVRAEDRAGRAVSTLIALLAATGAATDKEIVALLRTGGWPDPDLARLGAAGIASLDPLRYFVGPREIRRLRASEEERLGAAFDPRAFHARLLSEGPIPPRLIAAEWARTR